MSGGSGSRMVRGLAVLGSLLLVMAFSTAPGARGSTGGAIQQTFDVTQVDWDLSEADWPPAGPQGGPQAPLWTEEEDPFCSTIPSPSPDYTFTYKTTPVGVLPAATLLADEYSPTAPGLYPVMVLVHGGGFARGCRFSMDGVGNKFATDATLPINFISISIDYRMACNSADPAIPVDSPILTQHICDWTWSITDPNRSLPGAAVWDVQDAVAQVRNFWPYHSPNASKWNGKIALVGGSGGGNLAFLASVQPCASGVSCHPDAVAGWSPFPEFGHLGSTSYWTCDNSQTNNYQYCGSGYAEPGGVLEGGINRYLPCTNKDNPNYQSSCSSKYQQAAPYGVIASSGIYPPNFSYIANGGGPNSDDGFELEEQSSLRAANDFVTLLQSGFVLVQECIVDGNYHATKLLNQFCNNDTAHNVRWHTADYLANAVCPARTCHL